MSVPPAPSAFASPCIKVCMLDAKGVCIGCGRDLSEIAGWSRMTHQQQQEVCRLAAERKGQIRTA